MGTFGEKVGLYFSSGVGEGEKNNLSCSVVLGLFRDGLVFFRPCACIWAELSSF